MSCLMIAFDDRHQNRSRAATTLFLILFQKAGNQNMKITCFDLFAFVLFAWLAQNALAWKAKINDDIPEKPSLTLEFLSILEEGLTYLTEHVQHCQTQTVECENLQQKMDSAMKFYKASRKQEDAVKALEVIDLILDMDELAFPSAQESAYGNALFIARDRSGLPNHDKKPYEPDPDSKAFQLGSKIGAWIKRYVLDKELIDPIFVS